MAEGVNLSRMQRLFERERLTCLISGLMPVAAALAETALPVQVPDEHVERYNRLCIVIPVRMLNGPPVKLRRGLLTVRRELARDLKNVFLFYVGNCGVFVEGPAERGFLQQLEGRLDGYTFYHTVHKQVAEDGLVVRVDFHGLRHAAGKRDKLVFLADAYFQGPQVFGRTSVLNLNEQARGTP